MDKLKINEIFYSIQGEGARVGIPSIFVRFAHCNLSCSYCDTEFNTFKEFSIDEVKNSIKNYPSNQIIFTGGEPALQLNRDIVKFFRGFGYYTCIETNGTKKVPENLDYVVVAPKTSNKILSENFSIVNELRYPIKAGDKLPTPSIDSYVKFLSPIFDGKKLNRKNLNYCIDLCLKNPTWRLSVQTHKIWEVR